MDLWISSVYVNIHIEIIKLIKSVVIDANVNSLNQLGAVLVIYNFLIIN